MIDSLDKFHDAELSSIKLGGDTLTIFVKDYKNTQGKVTLYSPSYTSILGDVTDNIILSIDILSGADVEIRDVMHLMNIDSKKDPDFQKMMESLKNSTMYYFELMPSSGLELKCLCESFEEVWEAKITPSSTP
jgi:hypothetical protein